MAQMRVVPWLFFRVADKPAGDDSLPVSRVIVLNGIP